MLFWPFAVAWFALVETEVGLALLLVVGFTGLVIPFWSAGASFSELSDEEVEVLEDFLAPDLFSDTLDFLNGVHASTSWGGEGVEVGGSSPCFLKEQQLL